MRAIATEKCITEGKLELQRLFEFVENNATEFKAYEMEKSIFKRILKIGLIAMQYYFSIFGKLKVPRSIYRCGH